MNKLFIFVLAKRICVIGAGVGGLTAARYLKEADADFTVFEATRHVGGTWRYDPRTGKDENGMPLYTSMYENFRSNVPKQVLAFRGYPIPESVKSFPTAEEYYEYIQSFAIRVGLLKYIKFRRIVTLVTKQYTRWKVKYKDVVSKEEFEEYFDYVIICNGQYSKPKMPNITGEDLFRGTIIHSHDYRTAFPYKNRRVLIIGGGPSGMDIAMNIARDGKVFHSHRRENCRISSSPNYVRKRDIDHLIETGVVFKDGTFEEVDDVIYCTGYEYDYPFLDETCGLKLEPNFISPLHKLMVNINEPTMFIMGLVTEACSVVALDTQARYITALIRGDFTLPSKYDMLLEWEHLMADISAKKLPVSQMFVLNTKENSYYGALAAESRIDPVPPVLFKIRFASKAARCFNYKKFRDYEYHALGYETFSAKLAYTYKVVGPSSYNKSAVIW